MMDALVLKAYRRLEMAEVPLPVPGPDEVLVAVRACAICGSDVHGYDGSTGRRRPPLIMGHEAAGVVAEVGAGVSDLAPGDRVTFDSTIYCGRCGNCRRGRINLCDDRRVLGVSCAEYRRDGAFARYVAVPQRVIYRLPPGLSFEHAAMIEPLAIAFHAVGRVPLRLGDTAVVVGAGVIGLLIVQALRLAGCGRIVAADIDPARLALARRLGADETLDVSADRPEARLREAVGGDGADVAFDAVGRGDTLRTALTSLRKGGFLSAVGNLDADVPMPLQQAVTRELTVAGSCASCGEYPACIEALAAGRVDVASLISAVAPLEEGPAWFERLYGREPGLIKVVLRPGGDA